MFLPQTSPSQTVLMDSCNCAMQYLDSLTNHILDGKSAIARASGDAEPHVLGAIDDVGQNVDNKMRCEH